MISCLGSHPEILRLTSGGAQQTIYLGSGDHPQVICVQGKCPTCYTIVLDPKNTLVGRSLTKGPPLTCSFYTLNIGFGFMHVKFSKDLRNQKQELKMLKVDRQEAETQVGNSK